MENPALLCRYTVQGRICVIVWIVFKIHLRYKPVFSAAHLEVDVGRPEPVGSGRIGCWLDCLEAIPAFQVGRQRGRRLQSSGRAAPDWSRWGASSVRKHWLARFRPLRCEPALTRGLAPA